jgi:transcriptional regulator with XRE-family HTH domain
MSLEALASHFGVGKSATSSWETGKSKPSSDDLVKLCDILSTDPNYLLIGKTSDNSQVLVSKEVWDSREQELVALRRANLAETENARLKNPVVVFEQGQLAN